MKKIIKVNVGECVPASATLVKIQREVVGEGMSYGPTFDEPYYVYGDVAYYEVPVEPGQPCAQPDKSGVE